MRISRGGTRFSPDRCGEKGVRWSSRRSARLQYATYPEAGKTLAQTPQTSQLMEAVVLKPPGVSALHSTFIHIHICHRGQRSLVASFAENALLSRSHRLRCRTPTAPHSTCAPCTHAHARADVCTTWTGGFGNVRRLGCARTAQPGDGEGRIGANLLVGEADVPPALGRIEFGLLPEAR